MSTSAASAAVAPSMDLLYVPKKFGAVDVTGWVGLKFSVDQSAREFEFFSSFADLIIPGLPEMLVSNVEGKAHDEIADIFNKGTISAVECEFLVDCWVSLSFGRQ